MDIGKFATSFG